MASAASASASRESWADLVDETPSQQVERLVSELENLNKTVSQQLLDLIQTLNGFGFSAEKPLNFLRGIDYSNVDIVQKKFSNLSEADKDAYDMCVKQFAELYSTLKQVGSVTAELADAKKALAEEEATQQATKKADSLKAREEEAAKKARAECHAAEVRDLRKILGRFADVPNAAFAEYDKESNTTALAYVQNGQVIHKSLENQYFGFTRAIVNSNNGFITGILELSKFNLGQLYHFFNRWGPRGLMELIADRSLAVSVGSTVAFQCKKEDTKFIWSFVKSKEQLGTFELYSVVKAQNGFPKLDKKLSEGSLTKELVAEFAVKYNIKLAPEPAPVSAPVSISAGEVVVWKAPAASKPKHAHKPKQSRPEINRFTLLAPERRPDEDATVSEPQSQHAAAASESQDAAASVQAPRLDAGDVIFG